MNGKILEAMLSLRDQIDVGWRSTSGICDDVGWRSTSGICAIVVDTVKSREDKWSYYDITKHLLDLFLGWPHHSGDYHYPVSVRDSPVSAAHQYHYADIMWDGEYGKQRKELLDYVIKKLQHITAANH